MRMSLSIGGALLALAAFASAADARMGGGMNMSSSMGSPRGFSPDGRTFSPDGFTARIKGANWKRPIDSDGGILGDPPIKPPKASTQPRDEGGYIDQYGNYHHGRYNGGGNASNNGPPLACVGRIGGC